MKPPYPVREKILGFGPPACGKSTAHLSIAKLAAKTKSSARFFIIDTDDAMGRMLASPKYEDILDRLTILPVHEWPDYLEARDVVMSEAKEGDWVVVDLVDKAWDEPQDFYLREVKGMEPEEYFSSKKKELVEAGRESKKYGLQLYEGIDWGVVKKQYNAFINPLLLRGKFHLYLAAEQKDISDEWGQPKKLSATDKGINQMFGHIGARPAGNKSLPYRVHTILHFGKVARGFLLTTAKDREREDLDGVSYGDFASRYLLQTAGWTLK